MDLWASRFAAQKGLDGRAHPNNVPPRGGGRGGYVYLYIYIHIHVYILCIASSSFENNPFGSSRLAIVQGFPAGL